MKQHGGMIPFSALSKALNSKNSKNSKNTKKRKKRKTVRKKTSTNEISVKYDPKNYSIGTIIRFKNNLWKLNKKKKWFKIKV